MEAGPPPCEEWTLSYGQAEEGTVTRKKAQNHQNPPRYEEMVRLELWTNSMATNSSHDRYHSARPQTPLLPILIRARPGQRLTTPLTRDEKEQVETARAAAPAAVIAMVPMGQLRSIVDIRGEHMARLRRVVVEPIPTGQETDYYLHDEVIDAYMFYLQQRESHTRFYDCTFFRRLLARKGKIKFFKHHSLKCWGRNADKRQLFSNDKLIIPTNTGGNQWVLTVAYLRGKRLTVYDPTDTRDKHTNLLEALREYLRVEADREKNVEILESIDSWRLEICTDAPRQKNAVDRGVFICMYADCISAREPLDFDAADMNTCRDRIAHTIIREFGTQGGAREGRGRAENAAADEQHGADEKAWDTRCREEAAALLCEMGIRLPENDGGAVQAAAAVGAGPAQASGKAASCNIASPRKKARGSSSPDSRSASEPGPGPGAIKRDSAGAPKALSHGREGGDSGGGDDSGGRWRPPATAGETSGCGVRSAAGGGGRVGGSGFGGGGYTERGDWSHSNGESSGRGNFGTGGDGSGGGRPFRGHR